ncbi:head scaffolding protein [Acinetobacter phage Petty]|uniref:Scaffold protein n=1 Tax=Acinetobacter phage Petty TaxID=1406779 RepID=U5PZN4_9CAUD|nr:head scaffolding protein [Acinetobacter phage Petty]AGY48003.1 scaffold protein [Acinetobacter phage Petty]
MTTFAQQPQPQAQQQVQQVPAAGSPLTPNAVPAGIPQIPAGAQLGGEGYAQNQAAAVPQYQQPQPQFQTPVPQQPVVPVVPVAPVVPKQQPNPYQAPAIDPNANYIDTSIQYLASELNVSPDAFDAVLDKALEHGDINLINPAAMGNLTPEQAQRVTALATAAYQQVQEQVRSAQNTVYELAGGEAAWNNAIQTFNSTATEQEKAYVEYLIDQKVDARAAGEYVLNVLRTSGRTNNIVQAPVVGGVGTVTHGLSRAEYMAEVAKLEQEIGNRSFDDPMFAGRMAALDQRRALGRQQGR